MAFVSTLTAPPTPATLPPRFDLHVLMVEHGKVCPSCAKGGSPSRKRSGQQLCPLAPFKQAGAAAAKALGKGAAKVSAAAAAPAAAGKGASKGKATAAAPAAPADKAKEVAVAGAGAAPRKRKPRKAAASAAGPAAAGAAPAAAQAAVKVAAVKAELLEPDAATAAGSYALPRGIGLHWFENRQTRPGEIGYAAAPEPFAEFKFEPDHCSEGRAAQPVGDVAGAGAQRIKQEENEQAQQLPARGKQGAAKKRWQQPAVQAQGRSQADGGGQQQARAQGPRASGAAGKRLAASAAATAKAAAKRRKA